MKKFLKFLCIFAFLFCSVSHCCAQSFEWDYDDDYDCWTCISWRGGTTLEIGEHCDDRPSSGSFTFEDGDWEEYWDEFDNDHENEYGDGDNGYDQDEPNDALAALIEGREETTQNLVAELFAQMQAVYGNDIAEFPDVRYKHVITESAYAFYENGIIYVLPSFFEKLTTDGDRKSSLIHERTHWENDRDGINTIVAMDENRVLISVKTDSPTIIGEAEAEFLLNKCNEEYQVDLSEGILYFSKEAYIDFCMSWYYANYEYYASNHYKGEKEARQAELQAEADGLFTLSDDYRQSRLDEIQTYQWKYERALNFEQQNGYNPDGTKQ